MKSGETEDGMLAASRILSSEDCFLVQGKGSAICRFEFNVAQKSCSGELRRIARFGGRMPYTRAKAATSPHLTFDAPLRKVLDPQVYKCLRSPIGT